MLCCEIIRTCSHEKIAEAAVLSIGASFRDRVVLLASTAGMPAGAYVAGLVADFEEEAGERDVEALRRATSGSDMPVLDGLRWIVEFMLDGRSGAGTESGGGRRVRSGGRSRAERRAQAA